MPNPKKPLEPQPMRRTLSSVENDLGQCASDTRDRLEERLVSQEVLPSISSDLGIDDELLATYDLSAQDSLELAKAKEALKKEELESAQIEIADLEKKIMDSVNEFEILERDLAEARMDISESKKISRKAKVGLRDLLVTLGNVKTAKAIVKRLDQLKLEFEMWTKRLHSINKRSKVLQNSDVIRLVVHLHKMDKVKG